VLEALRRVQEVETRWRSTLGMSVRRRVGLEKLPKTLLDKLYSTRERTIDNLDRLVSMTVESVVRGGGKVYLAGSAEEAARYILGVARDRRVSRVIKSKSMTTEEIALNQLLESGGIEVIETDLGQRIVQLAGQHPSHILAPAIHMSRADISGLVRVRRGVDVPPDPHSITRFFRRDLWTYFESAEMGVTGANIVVAETGHVVLVTNEGNGRLVTSMPRIVVSVAGVEKIVETWEEAFDILRVLPVSSVGRSSTSYITVTGPRGMSRYRVPSEFHLVLLDNGRIAARDDPLLRDALRCIRCSACLDVCPTFRILGGHIFGDVYAGPMGVPWTAITRGVEAAAGIAEYCVSCSLCLQVCPVRIDIPITISWIKSVGGGPSWREKMLSMYELYARAGSRLPRIFNWLQGSRASRSLMERVLGIDRHRLMHRFRGGDLYSVLGRKYVERGNADIVYFPDTYAAYIDWSLGVLAVRLLEYMGYAVAVPRTRGAGMPSIQYGLLAKAKRIAEGNVRRLKRYVERGARIVCTEPTAAYCLREAYPKILSTPASRMVAEASWELTCLVAEEVGAPPVAMRLERGGRVFYHHPCHSRILAEGRPAVRLLTSIGLDVSTYDYGCCGIAGTWGMRTGPDGYSISAEIGRRVASIIHRFNPREIVTESSVCALQLRQFAGLRVRHTLRYLAEGMGIEPPQIDILDF